MRLVGAPRRAFAAPLGVVRFSLIPDAGARALWSFLPRPLREACRYSDARIEEMLRNFSQQERDDVVHDGRITVTCEFFWTKRVYDPADFRV
ncbi:hypothetical protein GJ654_14480 [Rhodoblastus acidophilus]|uniref:Uncharacterized protein n=1 Tax=Rhodoblastus acidophilus TaxID=1074 RepID=A0A6N8DSM6_RHOAC|nr:Hsp33 family molecular chaperone HslO [Rhodoblastus acidophilus]MCW2275227.1 redox-regulated HSP33 family molecular chaperone [Rhodoblastus acidophilus]MTV32193.1 hypothetical protein [Rhodoblastus acidophilus]